MVKIYKDLQTGGDGTNKTHSISEPAKVAPAEIDCLDSSSELSHSDIHSESRKTSSVLPQADPVLVEEVRVLLRKEFESNENFETVYSRIHYDELMDPNSPNTCWRYLLQRDMCVDETFKLMKQALAWRQQSRVDVMQVKDMVKDFWLHAPMGFAGKAKSGNQVIYAISKNFRKADPMVKQIIRDYTAFVLFDWERKHRHDLSQIELVFDVRGAGVRNIDLDYSYWLISIRDFIPARIKVIYFVGIPFLIRPIIKLIISWLPERLKRLVKCGGYDELVRANIDEESIPEEVGGKADKWRLAPIESRWAHEHDNPDMNEILEKICEACDINTSQEHLDKLYKMQLDFEKNYKSSED